MIQNQFLNYLIRSGDLSVVTQNRIDQTFFDEYKEEFKFIQDHIQRYNSVPDEYTFLNRFPNFDIIDVRETSTYLVDALYADKRDRQLVSTFSEVRQHLQSGDGEKAKQALIDGANSITSSTTNTKCVDIIHDTSRYQDFLQKSQNFSSYFIPTGFPELDQAIGGGWDKNEELVTIVARPGVGKSWILLKCAMSAVSRGLTVGYYSGEMSETKVAYRFDTLFGGMSNKDISHGNVVVQNEYKQYIDTLSEKCPGKLKILTPEMLGHYATVNDLRAFVETEQLDILCVDQHSLMDDVHSARDPVVKAANISKDLKSLQVLKKIPILAVSQQHRSNDASDDPNAILDVSHIAQTDRIGQDSTIVLFLEQKDGILTITLAKCRDSAAGKRLKYAIDLNIGVFSFLPVDNGTQEGREESVKLGNQYEDPSTVQFGNGEY